MARTGQISITQGESSIASNTSPVTVAGTITTTGGTYRGDHRPCTYNIYQGDKLLKTDTFAHGAPANTTTTLFSVTVTVAHKDDGTSDPITASFNYDNGWCTASNSLELSPIARKSLLGIDHGTLGTPQTWVISEKDSSFTHKIRFTCGSLKGYLIGSDTAASSALINKAWTPPIEWATQKPSGTSVSVTFVLETYLGDTLIGSNTYAKNYAIPDSVAPSLSMEVSDANGYADTYGGYIKGRSKIAVVLTASGAQGSTTTAYKTTIDGKTYTEEAFTTDYVASDKETLMISATVTDSRGRSKTVTQEVKVLSYSPPVLSAVTISRCDVSGAAKATGAYLRVRFDSAVTPLGGKNSAAYKVEYKKYTSPDSEYITEYLEDYDGVYSISGGTFIFEANTRSSYNVILTVADSLEATTKNGTGPTANTFWSCIKAKCSFAFGKIAELANTFDVGWAAIFRKDATTYDSEGTGHVIGDTLRDLIAKFADYLPRSGGSGNPMTGSMYFENNVNIWAKDSKGMQHDVFEPKNSDDDTLIGWDNYENKSGDTMLFGYDAWIGVSNIAIPNKYRPYYRQGEGYSIGTLATAGFVTNEGKDVYFILPVTKYIVGSPAISITSVDGFILRQGGKYTHGSGATTWVKPDSYEEVLLPSNGIRIKASFSDTTNAVNNDVIGIWWSGMMTFS